MAEELQVLFGCRPREVLLVSPRCPGGVVTTLIMAEELQVIFWMLAATQYFSCEEPSLQEFGACAYSSYLLLDMFAARLMTPVLPCALVSGAMWIAHGVDPTSSSTWFLFFWWTADSSASFAFIRLC